MKDENSLSTFWAAAVSSRPAGVLHSLSYVAFLEELLMLLIAQNVMFWMPEEMKTKSVYPPFKCGEDLCGGHRLMISDSDGLSGTLLSEVHKILK